MAKYQVERSCFYLGKLYQPGESVELNDKSTVAVYRFTGYIGDEIKTKPQKGRKVKKNASVAN